MHVQGHDKPGKTGIVFEKCGPWEERRMMEENIETKEVTKRRKRGGRKPEWNNPNRKDERRITNRQNDYENMMANPNKYGIPAKFIRGYKKPGSAS